MDCRSYQNMEGPSRNENSTTASGLSPQVTPAFKTNPKISIFQSHYATLHKALKIITDSMEQLLSQAETEIFIKMLNKNENKSNDTQYNGYVHHQKSVPICTKKEQRRKTYSPAEREFLEKCFSQNQYPTNDEVEWISQKLSITQKQVFVYFQNHRKRIKDEQRTNSSIRRRQKKTQSFHDADHVKQLSDFPILNSLLRKEEVSPQT